jgi:hypothetical protein
MAIKKPYTIFLYASEVPTGNNVLLSPTTNGGIIGIKIASAKNSRISEATINLIALVFVFDILILVLHHFQQKIKNY